MKTNNDSNFFWTKKNRIFLVCSRFYLFLITITGFCLILLYTFHNDRPKMSDQTLEMKNELLVHWMGICLNILQYTCTGHAAPSARAQIVCPSICLLISNNISISFGSALPSTRRHIILFIHPVPSRQGVHYLDMQINIISLFFVLQVIF